MASLADSFLEDLDGLSGDSDAENETPVNDEKKEDGENGSSHNEIEKNEVEEEEAEEEEEEDMDLDEMLKEVKGNGVHSVAALRKSERYRSHLEKIENYSEKLSNGNNSDVIDSEEYDLVVNSNDLMVEIDDEIIAVHRFVVDLYSKKFPELESLVPNSMDYVRVVQKIANETDMTKVDLSSLLPSATVMGVSVTGSTTSGHVLPQESLDMCLEGCDEALFLEKEKNIILQFVEGRMMKIAPNTSNILGTRITAQLIGLAGGIYELSRIPSCNVQVLGQQKKVLAGFSSVATLPHTGLIYYSDLIQNAPQYLRSRALRAVAGKVTLAARVDSQPNKSENTNGAVGARFRQFLEEKIEKWQEPQKAKTKKALPRPDEKPRRKRGGKRYRKAKERTQMTDVRKEANRQSFATADNEYGDNAMGISYGRLGQEGSGNLRVIRKEQKQMAKKLKAASYASSSKVTNGLSSSLAFTPVQGIELMNPQAAEERIRKANKKYFSAESGFMSVGVNKK